ncbi:hypothetical protein PSCICJ_47610 [Pseudomonas cichorii]|nr:hypothetical protein PSCICJ_47610 [Pseudomonas cichorii]
METAAPGIAGPRGGNAQDLEYMIVWEALWEGACPRQGKCYSCSVFVSSTAVASKLPPTNTNNTSEFEKRTRQWT